MPVAHVIQRPYYYSFSKNQITWRFFVSAVSDPGCKLQFKLMADTANDIPAVQRIYEEEFRPANTGYLNVTVQDIIDSMIEYTVPVVTGGNVIAAQNLKLVTISFRRISDAEPDTDWNDSEPAIYVIKGGIELLKHDYNNYFYNYHGPNKVFATWLPKNRLVSVADEWWMSILFANADITAPVLAARKLRTILEYTDGSSSTFLEPVPATGSAYLLYHFNIGKIVKTAIDPDKMLWRFTIQVIGNVDSTLYSDAYTMYADYRQFYDYKIFNFFNSLGGLDHVRILAESEQDYTRGYIEADLFANSNTPGSPADHQYFQANFSRLNSTKTDTGYRHTKAEVLAYQEMLTSGLIFEIWNNSNQYRLIGLLLKSGKLIKTTDKRFGFAIEWRYPFTETVYTPEIDLGNAYLPCIVIAVTGTPSLPDGQVGVPYDFSFPITGSAPVDLSDVVKLSWMTIIAGDTFIQITGTPDATGDDLAVSFTLNNCSGTPVVFSDTIDIARIPPSLEKISEVRTPDNNTNVFQVGSSVVAGDTFEVEVYSHPVAVVATTGDTPADIAIKLRDAVNGTSESAWNSAGSAPAHGTSGFPPVATASGSQLTIVLNRVNSFASGAY